MNPDYPETLYACLDKDGKIALSITEPQGQWAEYVHREREVYKRMYRYPRPVSESAEYYELWGFSDEFHEIWNPAPIYLHTKINTVGNYVIQGESNDNQ
jgi:hypothetical protein